MITILAIKKYTDLLIEFIKTDYENAIDKNNSFIYRVLKNSPSEGWDFIKNAVTLFSRDDTDKRKLETRLMFDRTRADLPTIHVREPSKGAGGYDNIGILSGGQYVNEDLSVSEEVRKTFNSKFELLITSGNSLECILIQELIESAILASVDSLTIPYFDLINFTSKELMMADDLERNMLFMKSIELDVKYEKSGIPTLFTQKNINSIIFNKPTLINWEGEVINGESENGTEEDNGEEDDNDD